MAQLAQCLGFDLANALAGYETWGTRITSSASTSREALAVRRLLPTFRKPQNEGHPPRIFLAPCLLKLSFAKRLGTGTFWQKRYYDRNIRNEREFREKLRYIHRNPVKRELVLEPGEWKWSSFRHYALREKGPVEIESEWTARDREKTSARGPGEDILDPRLAPKTGARTWATAWATAANSGDRQEKRKTSRLSPVFRTDGDW